MDEMQSFKLTDFKFKFKFILCTDTEFLILKPCIGIR